jgi:hypothetical protein
MSRLLAYFSPYTNCLFCRHFINVITQGLARAFLEKGNLFKLTEMLNEDPIKTGSTVSAHLPNP